MAFTSIAGVRVCGIAAAVPATVKRNNEIGGDSDREYIDKLSKLVGVYERRVVAPQQFGSDLALTAANSVMTGLNWDSCSIDLLIVATQTPDRLFPGISFTLHRQLGLPKTTPVFDINLGCSAFTHGLWMVSSLLAGIGKRALLINVDIMSRTLGASDLGSQVLFGDAGTATALEIDNGVSMIHAVLMSDGKGTESVCYPNSAMSASTDRTPEFLINGPAVLGLALRSVPKLIGDVLAEAELSLEQIGLIVPHQANVFILEKLSDRLKLQSSRLIISMGEHGNTSSASIPLALCSQRDQVAAADRSHTLMVGFGTGFSLSAVLADLQETKFFSPVEVG
jgi:3-oxoacyl-[acyl-carrier-protein] synthase-3